MLLHVCPVDACAPVHVVPLLAPQLGWSSLAWLGSPPPPAHTWLQQSDGSIRGCPSLQGQRLQLAPGQADSLHSQAAAWDVPQHVVASLQGSLQGSRRPGSAGLLQGLSLSSPSGASYRHVRTISVAGQCAAFGARPLMWGTCTRMQLEPHAGS